MKREPGKLIVFEGIDGAGKGVHLDRFTGLLNDRGIVHTRTREPGGSSLGVKLREGVLNDPVCPWAETMLFLADRAEHVQSIVKELEQGFWVVCDRFDWSTIAYQGTRHAFNQLKQQVLAEAKEGAPWTLDVDAVFDVWKKVWEELESIEAVTRYYWSSGSRRVLTPDHVILLDVPVSVAMKRAVERSQESLKIFEERGEDYFYVVRKAYLELQRAHPNSSLIDATGDKDHTWFKILDACEKFMP